MKKLYSTRELAEHLGLTPETIKNWRKKGKGPRFIRINGKNLRYRIEDIDGWLLDLANKTDLKKREK